MDLISLKKRADFLRISATGEKFVVSTVILLITTTPDKGSKDTVRLGLTVSKKNGNAIKRNRIRRRLREAFKEIAAEHVLPGHDYVLISRKNALHCPYSTLIRDLTFALPRAHRALVRTAKSGEDEKQQRSA